MAQTPLPAPVPPAPLSNLSFPTPDDLDDIQGDVILGIPKRFEDFLFFSVTNVADFKRNLKQLIPCITTTAQVQALRQEIEGAKHSENHKLIKVIGTQISFTSAGLEELGIEKEIGDAAFTAGQLARAQVELEDKGTLDPSGKFVPDWLPAFKESELHGLITVAGDCKASVEEGLQKARHILGKSVRELLRIEGNVRPDSQKGHEHFGFLDGVSLPAIPALTGRKPGQQEVKPGVIICGQDGDEVTDRPTWTKNGTIVVYRQLNQLVPEFNKFLHDNAIVRPGLSREKGSELLGARLIGRWKSGAPIDLRPTEDDPKLAKDPNRNNFFDYGYNDAAPDQTRCPFAAHIRKTAPRSFLDPDTAARHQIMRSGIPFGPEVTQDEHRTCTTRHTRGLSFLCYQSNLSDGFEFMQRRWCNNENFPPVPQTPAPGVKRLFIGQDPIVGQNRIPVQPGDQDDRKTAGIFSNDPGRVLDLPNEFVVSKGGIYSFAPSLSALRTKFTV